MTLSQGIAKLNTNRQPCYRFYTEAYDRRGVYPRLRVGQGPSSGGGHLSRSVTGFMPRERLAGFVEGMLYQAGQQ